MHEYTEKIPVILKEVWEPQKKMFMISYSSNVIVENIRKYLEHFVIRCVVLYGWPRNLILALS